MKEETVGLSELSSVVLSCDDCQFKLVDIVVIETNGRREQRGKPNMNSRYSVVDCPKCGNKSFSSEILEGTVVIGSVRDGYNVEVEDTEVDDNGVVNVILKVTK
jgi:hypothetical protein